ncbi:MAG: hypothetical protein ACLR2G_00265 [Phascolarctobacterium faecium]
MKIINFSGVVNDAVAYAMAVGECNAAMGRNVAAPTAGAAAFCRSTFGIEGITIERTANG